jgi:lysophospholipase
MPESSVLNQPRFTQPDGWRWHTFRTSRNYKIRMGSVQPKDKIPSAAIVCLPGLSEFSEKYFELAHDMLSRNFSFWILDWYSQGESDRAHDNRSKISCDSFDNHVDDLNTFIMDYIKPASMHPAVGRIPMVMIGHSMGGHIGLRYLSEKQNKVFSAAAFSAPMLRIAQLDSVPFFLQRGITSVFQFAKDSYAIGASDWGPTHRADPPGIGNFSSDPARDALHRAWFETYPYLRVGGPTWKWVHEAVKSCALMARPDTLKKIEIPVLLAVAGDDRVVSSNAIRRAAKFIPHAEVLDLPQARHEILMERDQYRKPFMRKFDALIQAHVSKIG